MILLLLLVPFWIYNNNHFVLSADEFFGAQATADYINGNIGKEAGIMALPGYTVKLIHLTDNRIVGLYPRPDKLVEVADYFDIDYIVFGRTYTLDQYDYYPDAVAFIQSNPDKFELVQTILEDYSGFYDEEDSKRTDEVFIYKIKREK